MHSRYQRPGLRWRGKVGGVEGAGCRVHNCPEQLEIVTAATGPVITMQEVTSASAKQESVNLIEGVVTDTSCGRVRSFPARSKELTQLQTHLPLASASNLTPGD